MDTQLELTLKREIAYTDQNLQCSGCIHFNEVEDRHTDRMWNPECHLFIKTLGAISVKPGGRCKHHSDKPKAKQQDKREFN